MASKAFDIKSNALSGQHCPLCVLGFSHPELSFIQHYIFLYTLQAFPGDVLFVSYDFY